MPETTIATGIYTIENVDRRNDVFLADDGRGTLVAGSSEDDADPPPEAHWKVTRLRNGRYHFSPAAQRNMYASWPTGLRQGSEIVTSPTPHHWVVTQTRDTEKFVISHVRHQLYWGIEDDEAGTPVRLRHAPTGSGNQWRFHRLSSTTVTPPIAIESQNMNRTIDCQTVTVPAPSQPKEVDGGQPASATPVVPQTVIESLTIDSGLVDSQTPNQSQTTEVIEATSAAVIPQDVVESPHAEENLNNQTATIPTQSQTSDVDDGLPPTSTPIIPQNVVGSLAIDGSKVDSQIANAPNRSQISEAVDAPPSRPTSVVPQSVIESPNIDESLNFEAPAIPTRDLLREEVDSRQATPTPVVPQSVVESRTIADGQTASSPSQSRGVADDRQAIRHMLEGHTWTVNSVAFSPDGKQIVFGSDDCTIRVWDVGTQRLALEPIEGHSGGFNSVAYSPDGKRIVSGSDDKTVRIWDAQSGTLSWTLNGHTDWVRSVACSPDGKRIVSGSDDNTVRVWDVETGCLILGPLLRHTEYVHSVHFSPDGKQLLSGSRDMTVRVWDAETGRTIRTFRGESPIWSAKFSPDSKQNVFGGAGGYVGVWDMQSSDSLTLMGHKSSVHSVAFSPDGERIVSGGWDNQIIVWDAKLGKSTGRLEGHTRDVNSVAFSPDGKWIVSGSDDRTVRIWEADRLDAMS